MKTGGVLAAALLLAAPVRAELSAEHIELKVALGGRQPQMEQILERWVSVNTGSWNREGLARFAGLLESPLIDLDFEVSVEPGAELDLPGFKDARTGPILIAHRPARAQDVAKPLRFLLMGHYDTVFEADSDFQTFERDPQNPALARGPGVADMKGGLVVMLYALRALAETGALDRASWTILLNADEEIGSLGSRALIEREAGEADFGFVFEAAERGGGMVKSRRGLGQFHFEVQGIAAHSGSSHDQGRSAVKELASKILQIEALTDYSRGVTLNVGVIGGGTKRNIVPENAWAWVDLRYDSPELGEEVKKEIERIGGEIESDGTTTTVWGTLHRPPKLADEKVLGLLGLHAEVAQSLGLTLPEPVHAGGGTDGSLMGAVGLPTLDSMGVVGGNAHTAREFIDLPSLSERAATAAILFDWLIAGRALRPPEGAVD